MRIISGEERDAVLLDVLKRLDSAKPHADDAAWERCWEEAAKRYRETGDLTPAFLREGIVRHDGNFIAGMAEKEYVERLHRWLADQFKDCRMVAEYGCGTGYNLSALSRLLTNGATLLGLDYSQAAVDLVKSVGFVAGSIDMRNPTKMEPYPPCTGILTFGSMEQIGDPRPFIDWLIERRPEKVIHIEPIPELLDENNLMDWLSLQFHKKRGYTVGLLPYLQQNTKVEMLHVERSHFGSLLLESYAKIVWRPK